MEVWVVSRRKDDSSEWVVDSAFSSFAKATRRSQNSLGFHLTDKHTYHSERVRIDHLVVDFYEEEPPP